MVTHEEDRKSLGSLISFAQSQDGEETRRDGIRLEEAEKEMSDLEY